MSFNDEEENPDEPSAPRQTGQPMTFSRMQQQGYARPAPPQAGGGGVMGRAPGAQQQPQQSGLRGRAQGLLNHFPWLHQQNQTPTNHRPPRQELIPRNDFFRDPRQTQNTAADPLISRLLQERLRAPGFNGSQNPMVQQMMPGYLSSYQPFQANTTPQLGEQMVARATNFQGYQNPVQGQQQALVQESLANPSAYTTEMFKNNLAQANQALDEQYGLDKKHLDEEMARRGLFNSTMAVGHLGVLAVQHERTKANLGQNLLTQMAMGYQNDRASALGAANAYGAQGMNQFLGNEQAAGNAYDRAAGYEQAQNNLGLNTFQANNNEQAQRLGLGMQAGQQQFNNDLSSFNANEAASQSRLGNAMSYDNDIYNRSWQSNLLNNQNDQAMMALYLRMMGL